MKKYKLIKEFPLSPALNSIYVYNPYEAAYVCMVGTKRYLPQDMEMKEFWAPCMFTTRDGVDKYITDTYYEVFTPTGLMVKKTVCSGDEQVTEWVSYHSESEAINYSIKCNPQTIHYGVCPKGSWETRDKKGVDFDADNESPWLWFDTEEERNEYIALHKPMYSKQNIIDLLDTRGVEG
jgi:hypothetical protein